MPRQDVPYGGAICRLKERIAEIWDELGKKLHSINGVEGDAAGDVKIVSRDAAVVVTSDQVNHQIEVALDSSQLPAASVVSVNGQTGAVALTADDIPSDNGNVQTDLDNLVAADTTLQGNINAEALARQNADSTLQGNINAALATIPGEVSSQIANDATIAQLVTADGQNVKLSGNQSIGGVKTVITERTRTYSQQIANSDKVKNELDSYAPMVRTTGNQTISGKKSFIGNISFNAVIPSFKRVSRAPGIGVWWKIYTADASTFSYYTAFIRILSNRNNVGMIRLSFSTNSTVNINRLYGDNYPANSIIITIDNNNVATVWMKRIDSTARSVSEVLFEGGVNFDIINILTPSVDAEGHDEPSADDYAVKVIG